MRNYHISKALAVGIVILFVGTSIIPAQSSISLKKEPVHIPNSSGKTIYVDDDNTEGPWDGTKQHPYQHIQAGINNANEGDTVFVYSGTYYEAPSIKIDKLKLLGEDKHTTVIDGRGNYHILSIRQGGFNNPLLGGKTSGFTIKNCSDDESFASLTVIIDADYYDFSDNIVIATKSSSVTRGVLVMGSHNIISNNIVSNSGRGIELDHHKWTDSNIVSGNIVFNNIIGILDNNKWNYNDGHIISNNVIHNNSIGIYLGESGSISIRNNHISNNVEHGIFIEFGGIKFISKNNFIDNGKNADFIQAFFVFPNRWRNNFWSDYSGSGVYIIRGSSILFIGQFNWFNIEWNPAKKPYDIKSFKLLEEVK